MNNERLSHKDLIEECKPILKLLMDNFHPHTSVIISSDGIRVEETVFGLPIEAMKNTNLNLIPRFKEMSIEEVEDKYRELGEKYSNL